MKLKRSTYEVLQYFSTIDEILSYTGNGVLAIKDQSGSGFTEVEIPDFFDEQIVIRSLPKFLRLFSFPKTSKNDSGEPESLQDWTLREELNTKNGQLEHQMYLKSPGKTVKIKQGSIGFIEKRVPKKRFDEFVLTNSVKFQIDRFQYKQIITDCSLLDLDLITMESINEHLIEIRLSKKDSTINTDTSVYQIECDHEHHPIKATIMLNLFSLIDATDHQIEFGMYNPNEELNALIVKVKSFYTSDLIVKRFIVGINGD